MRRQLLPYFIIVFNGASSLVCLHSFTIEKRNLPVMRALEHLFAAKIATQYRRCSGCRHSDRHSDTLLGTLSSTLKGTTESTPTGTLLDTLPVTLPVIAFICVFSIKKCLFAALH